MRKTFQPRPALAGIAWPAVLWIAALHVGALLAVVPSYFTWSAVAIGICLYWLTAGLGICLTYHRLLTHRSFALRPRWLEYLFTAIGCCASEGGAIGWVADHRKHHAHADDELDVHSPGHGLAWAHMLWWMTPEVTRTLDPEYVPKWAPDLARDPVHRALDKFHFIFPLLMFIALYAAGGLPWLIWGGFVRSCLVLHSTWLVNSATHVWGYRSFQTRDTSTNLWWVALLTFGEGWHNNHHASQTSARHGLRWWELDATYWAICLMALVGLAHGVKRPRMGHASPRNPSPEGESNPSGQMGARIGAQGSRDGTDPVRHASGLRTF